ncbi:MAG TPA: dTDP-glucose 4,6-dehydratase, partial [Candidatus Eisenbacteria bacterium]|nr:dTDP-glucose 4,6-dehydratase [Candidatus Eisenbacteria bacterium]
ILVALGKSRDLIQLVTDRPGHDRRYAMTAKKLEDRIGFRPRIAFEAGLRETVDWYVEHRAWWERIKSGAFRDYYDRMYANR